MSNVDDIQDDKTKLNPKFERERESLSIGEF